MVEGYEEGKRDAWIEALRGRLEGIENKLDEISAKVNHIYGAAAALGAVAGAIVFAASRWIGP